MPIIFAGVCGLALIASVVIYVSRENNDYSSLKSRMSEYDGMDARLSKNIARVDAIFDQLVQIKTRCEVLSRETDTANTVAHQAMINKQHHSSQPPQKILVEFQPLKVDVSKVVTTSNPPPIPAKSKTRGR